MCYRYAFAEHKTAVDWLLSGLHASTSYKEFCTCSSSSPRLKATTRKISLQKVCSSSVGEAEGAQPEFKDLDKEQSRRYRRTVFGHEDWYKHRSTSRYKRHISGLLGSRIVRGLAAPLSTVLIIATAATTYETVRETGQLPPWCVSLRVDSSEPFNLTSFALSLLLVFRTNASYARWLDARKIWGGIVNRSRDIVRQGLTWMSPEQEALRLMLQRWVIAFPKSLMCHLCVDYDLHKELQGILEPPELEALIKVQHRPNYVIRVIAEIVDAAKLTDSEVFLMDTNLTFFMDSLGGCERIFKTPIPLSWTRHTSRFLVIWLAFLPFTLYGTCRWATVPVSAVIGLLLLGIEEIGVQIEEPFSILPLASICDGIESSVREMFGLRAECSKLVQSQIPVLPTAAERDGLPAGNMPATLTSNDNGPVSQ